MFLNNYSQDGTFGVFSTFSSVYLESCNFTTSNAVLNHGPTLAISSYLYVADSSSVTLYHCRIEGSEGSAGVVVLGRSSLVINRSFFLRNHGNEVGAISAASYLKVNIIDSFFEGNLGSVAGDLRLSSSEQTSGVSNSVFTHSKGGSSIMFE